MWFEHRNAFLTLNYRNAEALTFQLIPILPFDFIKSDKPPVIVSEHVKFQVLQIKIPDLEIPI